jgi:hypothetical protein
MHQRFPPLAGVTLGRLADRASDQQTLDRATAWHAAAEKARRKHPSIVDGEDVTFAQQLRQVRDRPVRHLSAGAIEAQQPGRAALGDRLLRDQLGR